MKKSNEEIQGILSVLGFHYSQWKSHEKLKNKQKERFFEIANERVGEGEAFMFINPDDGMVYQRSMVDGALALDDIKIQNENPDLWAKITRQVTEIIPLEDLDPAILEELKPYVHQGEPTPKLLAPRPAKPEELEEL